MFILQHSHWTTENNREKQIVQIYHFLLNCGEIYSVILWNATDSMQLKFSIEILRRKSDFVFVIIS